MRFSQDRRTRTTGAGRRQRRRLRLPRYKVTLYTYIRRRRRRPTTIRTRAPAAAVAAESWTPVCFQRWTGTRSRNRSRTCGTSPQWTDGRYPGAYRREYRATFYALLLSYWKRNVHHCDVYVFTVFRCARCSLVVLPNSFPLAL